MFVVCIKCVCVVLLLLHKEIRVYVESCTIKMACHKLTMNTVDVVQGKFQQACRTTESKDSYHLHTFTVKKVKRT